MARIKIDYGIDLGTTNSALCRMEKGEPIVVKTDVLKDTMPSCVSVNKKGSIKVGDGAYNTMKQDKRRATKSWHSTASNTYIEFKRTMGTDTTYASTNLGRELTSEALSAEVLKALKSFVTDEQFCSVVVTVPAKFTVNQKTATLEAAKQAGFTKCELLQEPIAAAMAYGLTAAQKDGLWMVFDFGGGTFDAALLRVEDGIMQVFDTEGDNYLGGKNLDYAIVDEVILPYLKENYSVEGLLADAAKKGVLRDAMKTYAEEAKNQLSFKEKEDIISNLGDLGEDEEGEEIELDLTLTRERAFAIMRPYFQKAVDICLALLKRNNLTGEQINKLILVGGPTHSPLIREMLQTQVTPNVDTSIDPMTAVATGAALYASTIDADKTEEDIEADVVKLDISYDSTTVETEVYIPVSLAKETSREQVMVELVRADKAWSSGKQAINHLGDVIEAHLVEQKANSFSILAYDEQGNRLPCFPEEITIIQGTKVGAAPLPYNIGIAVWSDTKARPVFAMAKGLEKNKPLPAIGVVNDRKTSMPLRPGVESDVLTIPIYQTDDYEKAEGRTAALFEYVADVVVTGDDIAQLVPEDSSVDITLKVDTSEQMTLEVHFPGTDETVEKTLDTSKKQSIEDAEREIEKGLKQAHRTLDTLGEEGIDTGDLRQHLRGIEDEHAHATEKKMVLQHLKEVMRQIEEAEINAEWPRLEAKLRKKFTRLERAQREQGNEETAKMVEKLREMTDHVVRNKDITAGEEVLDQIIDLYVQLTMVYQCAAIIRDAHANFDTFRWKNSTRARQIVNEGMDALISNPTVERIRPIAVDLLNLMPESQQPDGGSRLH